MPKFEIKKIPKKNLPSRNQILANQRARNRIFSLNKTIRLLNNQIKITAQGYAASFSNKPSQYQINSSEHKIWIAGFKNGKKQIGVLNELYIAQACLKYLILNYELIDKDRELLKKVLEGKIKTINDLYKQLCEPNENN